VSATGPALEAVSFPVAGMTCSSCVSRITRALRRLDGVQAVSVDLGRETVTVRREPASVSNVALAAALAEAGYESDLAGAVTTAVAPATSSGGFVRRLLGRSR
jgi:Cu+-exporting ATPase